MDVFIEVVIHVDVVVLLLDKIVVELVEVVDIESTVVTVLDSDEVSFPWNDTIQNFTFQSCKIRIQFRIFYLEKIIRTSTLIVFT